MNIPPTNDLSQEPPGPGFTERAGEFLRSVSTETFTWTDAKDLALRFAVPLFGIAASGKHLKLRTLMYNFPKYKLRSFLMHTFKNQAYRISQLLHHF